MKPAAPILRRLAAGAAGPFAAGRIPLRRSARYCAKRAPWAAGTDEASDSGSFRPLRALWATVGLVVTAASAAVKDSLRAVTLWATVGLAVAAASCRGNPDDLRAYLDEVKARPGEPVEALPQIRQPEGFVYEAAGRRSPFVPQAPRNEAVRNEAVRQPDTGPGPDLNREREFLEHYSLDALQMVGSVRSQAGLFGLMRTPEGMVHRLAAGDRMGRNHGRIVNISEREIRLVELIDDGDGGYLERSAAIVLAD